MLLHLALRREEVLWYGEKVLQISLVVFVVLVGLHLKKHRISFKTRRNSNGTFLPCCLNIPSFLLRIVKFFGLDSAAKIRQK